MSVIKQGSKKIVLISSGQPSLNPRLVKEADALTEAGYQVTVLYCYWNDWGTRHDALMLPQKKWKAVCVAGNPAQQRLVYFISRLLYKAARIAVLKLNINAVAGFAIARGSFFLSREAKKHNADLYIGHNLGALPAVIKAAKKFKKPCGFDAEDFHRFEVSDDTANPDVMLKTAIEDKYFPRLNYLSTSSPLISAEYQRYYPAIKPLTLLNVFPREKQMSDPVISQSCPLRLFWFSQTIGLNRGIEDIIKAMQLLKPLDLELHLLGFIDDDQKKAFINAMGAEDIKIIFHAPIPADEIIEMASQYHIGLATETGLPLNRDLCLTNKIFTYIQAGLAIIASDTAAQTALLAQYPTIGNIYQRGKPEAVAACLAHYANQRTKLLQVRREALKAGRGDLNWEVESSKLLSLVNKLLN